MGAIMNTLQDLALQYGRDIHDWPELAQRRAIVDLFDKDEAKKYPDWICDSVSEKIGCDDKARASVIAALRVDDPEKRVKLLGVILERALTQYPLDILDKIIDEHFYDWYAQDRNAREYVA